MTKIKHKVVLKGVIEGQTMKQAMKRAGYSDSYAKSPDKLAHTKSWLQLVAEVLSDDRLIRVHEELLSHTDWRARETALEKAYKLKGYYSPEKLQIGNEYETLSDEELMARRKAIIAKLKKR